MKRKDNRILIFGKDGFIAKNLIRELKKEKNSYFAFSKKKFNLLNNFSIEKINKIINKNDICIFISAIAPVKNASMLYKNFIILTNFLKLNTFLFKHIIYISSDAVYSDSKNPLLENSKKEPKNIHGIMHLCREEILKNYFKEKLCIIRPTLIYGKDDTHNSYGPNQFLRKINNNKNITLFGDGSELRDHISITDVIKLILLVVKKKYVGSINCATGELISFKKIATLLISLKKKKVKIISKKRSFPKPHGGFRPISTKLIKHNFPEFKFKNFRTGIIEIIQNNKQCTK